MPHNTPAPPYPTTPFTLDEGAYLPLIRTALLEDLQTLTPPLLADVTSTCTTPATQQAQATLVARQDLTTAGLLIAKAAFLLVDPTLVFTTQVSDGQQAVKGQALATINGSARALLTAERVALNILCHLSGIATLTHTMVTTMASTHTKLLDTRKTLPGLRALQKYAVRCGGGHNHRMGLYDMVMVKDNHIAYAGGIANALKAVQENAPKHLKVEVEVDTLTQLEDLLTLKAKGYRVDVALLDNMPLTTLKKAVQMAKGHIFTEASGNITLRTISKVAATGVDFISSGALTHSAPNADIGLDVL